MLKVTALVHEPLELIATRACVAAIEEITTLKLKWSSKRRRRENIHEPSVGDFVGASVRFGTVPGASIPLEARLFPGSRSRKAIAIKGSNGRSERI